MSDWITLDDKFYTSSISGVLGAITYGVEYNYKTGDYQLKEQSLLGGSSILYANGQWSSDALKDPKLFVDGDPSKQTAVAQQLAENVKKVSYAAFQTRGGTQKGNVINDSAKPANQTSSSPVSGSTVPGTSAPNFTGLLPKEVQDLFNDISAPGFPKIQNLEFKSTNEDKLFTDKALLKYPRDILENQQDTLQIQMFNYKAPLGETLTNPDKLKGILTTKGLQRNSALKRPLGTVILPIPGGIQDNNAVSWGDDSMNALNFGALAEVSQNPLKALAGIGALYGGAAAASAGTGGKVNLPAGTIAQMLVMSQIPGILGSPLLKPALVSMLLKAASFDISPEQILARGFGIVPNSNLELLFQGPTLRQFGFNWRMSPRSKEEAANVKRIIRFFKQGSAPRKLDSQSSVGAGSLLLGTPNVFKLTYRTAGNKEISGLNKFKICALANMQVVYAPDGQWAAYDEGQPVSLTMSLNFQEIEPVYESDYQDANRIFSDFKGKSDYSPVNDNDVGY